VAKDVNGLRLEKKEEKDCYACLIERVFGGIAEKDFTTAPMQRIVERPVICLSKN